MQARIRLDSIDKVKDFVRIAESFTGDIQISSGRHTVDGKSILGILSLNLEDALVMDVESGDTPSKLLQEVEPYLIAGMN